MSNASTILHYFELLTKACGVKMDGDMRSELRDALEDTDEQIDRLRSEVGALRRQVPDNR